MALPIQDIRSLSPGALVEVFEVDTTPLEPLAPSLYRFHSGVSNAQQRLRWQGATYQPYPMSSSGYEWTGRGTLPRPKLTVANITGVISMLNRTKNDLVGAKVTRKRTFSKYMDMCNFTKPMELAFEYHPNAGTGIVATGNTISATSALQRQLLFALKRLYLLPDYYSGK